MGRYDASEIELSYRSDVWGQAWARFRRSRLALVSCGVIAVLFLLAVFAPFIANEVPLYAALDGEPASWPVFRGFTGEDAAWMGGFGSVVVFLGVRRLLRRRLPRPVRARVTWPLLLVLGGLTFAWASRLEPENLAPLDLPGRSREPGAHMIWPPIPYGWQETGERMLAPGASPDHPLGTDLHGRDVAARMVYGARVSLVVGFVVVFISTGIGVVLGGLAGYFRGRADALLSWLIQVFACFPVLFTVVVMQAFLPPSLLWILLLLGLTRWTRVARLIRGEVMRLREAPFIVAARAQGVGDLRILGRHVVPNALAPVLVSAAFGVAGAVLLESALSFLGVGVPPPTPSWGEILAEGRDALPRGGHLVLLPGLAIFLTVVAYNLVGEALRDALDPRLREEAP